MKNLVSDVGGVLYSFDPSFDPRKHEAAFVKAMEYLGKAKLDLKSQLEGEREAVAEGLLQIYPHRSGVRNFLKNLTFYHGILVATSLPETTRYILRQIGIPTAGLEIFDMSDYGSKKDKEAWKKILRNYSQIDVIVEDGEKNLAAAGEAAAELGFTPRLYQAMPLLVG